MVYEPESPRRRTRGGRKTMSEPFAQYPYPQYQAPEPPRPRRSRHILGLTATAAVALAVRAGATVALQHGPAPGGNDRAAAPDLLSPTPTPRKGPPPPGHATPPPRSQR